VEHTEVDKKMGIILEHHTISLPQDIECVQPTLNEFLQQIPFSKQFLEPLLGHVFVRHVKMGQERLPT
jgi:hypothetical protein